MPFLRSRRRFTAYAAVATLALTAVTACGSNGSGSGSGDEGSGPVKIKLGVIPIIDIAPVQLGIKKGFFAKQGLQVTTQNSQGGAAIVPAVVSGDFQFGYSNLVSLLIAKSKGVPVRMVSVGARASDNELQDGSGQLLTDDPKIKTVADLAGKKIAVNTLRGINEVAVRSTLKAHGVSDDGLKLVEVPIPDMPAALHSGQVDAAMLSEPFISVAKDQGAHPLPVSYASMGPKIPFAAWFASESYAAKHPKVVKEFTAALQESLRYGEAHPDEARAALDTYLTLDKGVSAHVTLPGWDPTTTRDQIEPLAKLAVDTGLIDNLDPLDKLMKG
ncbi:MULTISPECIES: ABC transporter substrate-binding protein [unclassified Streptomyces]|uniref:ABC transporter substrate-binding protein n=1 Tax=unclassified Streptomyces TaxID=2593676 RepID=UPI002E2E8213|nr:ABC transporter substrate-binding protein [Streptomyces sp. NBC_00223]